MLRLIENFSTVANLPMNDCTFIKIITIQAYTLDDEGSYVCFLCVYVGKVSLMLYKIEQRLDKVLKEKQQAEKQRHERLVQTLSQTVTTAVNARLDKVVKSEMKNVVTTCKCQIAIVRTYISYAHVGMNRNMVSLTEQLTGHVQSWLSSTDAVVRETLTRALHAKVGSYSLQTIPVVVIIACCLEHTED